MILSYSLFDLLTKKHINQYAHSTDQALCISILSHLKVLLNTRRGSLNHLPEYGLPDVRDVFQGLPYSLNEFSRIVSQTISRYESRLSHIQVRSTPFSQKECIIHLVVKGELNSGKTMQYDSYFMGEGIAVIDVL